METSILNSFQQAGLYDILVSTAITEEQYKIFSMLKPKVFKDGNEWCVLYGDNIQDGIAGFGKTPFKAMIEFNKKFNEE